MPTAWQKAMRGPTKRKNAAWKIEEIREIRAETFEVSVRAGDDFFTARVYPGQQVDSLRKLSDKEKAKIIQEMDAFLKSKE